MGCAVAPTKGLEEGSAGAQAVSIRLTAWAWDLPIRSTEKMVLMCLCDYANEEGHCWPSVSTIARKCSKGERTVQAALKWLEVEGFCTRHERAGTSTNYTVHPRKNCTPAKTAPPQLLSKPPQELHPTPANLAPKPPMNHQEPSKGSASGDAPLAVDEVLEGWNILAAKHGLSQVRKLTDQRRRKVTAQARRFPVPDWQSVFGKISQSPFLRGENRQGWRCDFDFILSEGNFVKILEGKYDQQ